jgi:hypothetical protein
LRDIADLLLPQVRNPMRQLDCRFTVETTYEPFERIGDLGPAPLALVQPGQRPK